MFYAVSPALLQVLHHRLKYLEADGAYIIVLAGVGQTGVLAVYEQDDCQLPVRDNRNAGPGKTCVAE